MNWLMEAWNQFSLWTSTQPTFIQVAFGMGLFYVVLLLTRLLYHLAVYMISGLFAGRGRSKVKKGFTPASRDKKQVTIDDDAPPFVFR